eukprot:tig00020629_g12325.t1
MGAGSSSSGARSTVKAAHAHPQSAPQLGQSTQRHGQKTQAGGGAGAVDVAVAVAAASGDFKPIGIVNINAVAPSPNGSAASSSFHGQRHSARADTRTGTGAAAKGGEEVMEIVELRSSDIDELAIAMDAGNCKPPRRSSLQDLAPRHGQGHVLGNPHSINPTSNLASTLEADARKAVRTFFNVPDDYAVVFTANASGALRIVGECYTFGPGAPLLLSADNHNSVGGIREARPAPPPESLYPPPSSSRDAAPQFARAKGASVTYVPLTDELFMDEAALFRALHEKPAGQRGLFAYPAQSNVSGVKHPLAHVAAAREAGWDVLLDASAFVPTSTLDVAKWRPDFVAMSFYKARRPRPRAAPLRLSRV